MRPLSLREAVTVFRSGLNNPTSNTSQPIAPICRRTASKVLPMVARPRRPDEAPVLEGGGDGIQIGIEQPHLKYLAAHRPDLPPHCVESPAHGRPPSSAR